MMMRGIVIIAGNAVTISSGTTAGAEIAVESEKIAIGSEGTGTKRRAANTSHLGGNSMRVRKGKAIGATSTKRTNVARKRRKPVRTGSLRGMSRTPRSSLSYCSSCTLANNSLPLPWYFFQLPKENAERWEPNGLWIAPQLTLAARLFGKESPGSTKGCFIMSNSGRKRIQL